MSQPIDRGGVSPVVPKEFGGKWVAWNRDGTRIIASGETLPQCEREALEAGEREPRFERIPRPDVRIIGAAH